MFLKTLHLKNFRNYKEIKLDFDKNTILLIGDNGLGKTNLLEAIHYVSSGKSHRTSSQDDMIKWGSGYGLIRAFVASKKNDNFGFSSNEYDSNLIEIELDPGGRIKIRVNRAICKKKSEFISILPTVIFSPDDLSIIKGSPSLRRIWLDDILEKIYPDYYPLLLKYQKILNQRNSLLKSLSNEKKQPVSSTMQAWDENLVKYGTEIIFKRTCLFEDIKRHFPCFFNSFFENLKSGLFYVFSWERKTGQYLPLANSDNFQKKAMENVSAAASNGREYLCFNNKESSKISYMDKNEISEVFKEKLKENFARELAFKNTLTGPHRDDLTIMLNDKTFKSFGSQGQQRVAAVCLKFCELEILREKLQRDPVLLLDDVLSELDRERENRVLNIIGNRFQTFITTSNQNYANDVQGIQNEKIQRFVVRDNKVLDLNNIDGIFENKG